MLSTILCRLPLHNWSSGCAIQPDFFQGKTARGKEGGEIEDGREIKVVWPVGGKKMR